MVTSYKVVDFVFSAGKFAFDMRMAVGGNITKEELAGVTGLSDTTIAQYMSGTVSNMKIQHFIAVCNALDFNPNNYIELEK